MSWVISSVFDRIRTYSKVQELRLAEAVAESDLTQIKRLLKQGVDPNVKIVGTQPSPLIFLTFTKNWFTIPGGFNGDRTKHLYEIKSKQKCLQLLLEQGANPNVRDSFGRTMLSIAITWCMPDTVRLLLDFNADPNLRDKNALTPLMKAVILGIEDARPMVDKLRIAEHLIDSGANLDAAMEDGTTALMYAAAHARMEMADLLVAKGASLSLQDWRGNRALDLVQPWLHPTRRNYLQQILTKSRISIQQGRYYTEPEGDRLLHNFLTAAKTVEKTEQFLDGKDSE